MSHGKLIRLRTMTIDFMAQGDHAPKWMLVNIIHPTTTHLGTCQNILEGHVADDRVENRLGEIVGWRKCVRHW